MKKFLWQLFYAGWYFIVCVCISLIALDKRLNVMFTIMYAMQRIFFQKRSKSYWRKPQCKYFTSCFLPYLFHSCPHVIYDDDV